MPILIVVLIFIIIFVSVSFIGNLVFNKNVDNEIKVLFNKVKNKRSHISKADIEVLPQNVQRWLKYAQIIGKEKVTSVRLKQKATMRLEIDKRWMPVQAEQYFTTEEPSFIWKANIKMAPLFHIVGRDIYTEGKGNMLIKFLSLFNVANSKGKKINQGTLLRYLAEMVWFPTAVVNNFITWEEIDTKHAKATMTYKEV